MLILALMSLKPLPGRILVEIPDTVIASIEGKYDAKTYGICRDLSEEFDDEEYGEIVGKTVFWDTYKETALIERDGKRYTFLKIEDLAGYEDV